jgi:hypothetical protein
MGGPSSAFNFAKTNQRISNSICDKTTSDFAKFGQVSNTLLKGDGSGDREVIENRSFGKCRRQPQFCVPNVFDTQKRWLVPSNIQLEKPEFISPNLKVSPCKYAQSTLLSTASRLASKNRFVKRLLSSASCKKSQALPAANIQRQIVTNDLPPNGPGLCAKNVRFIDQLGSTNFKRQRVSNPCLPRRLPVSTSGPPHAKETRSRDCKSSPRTGLADKLRKVNFIPSESNRIFRDLLGSSFQPKIPSAKEKHSSKTKDKSVTKTKISKLKGSSEHCGVYKLCQFPCLTGTPESSSATKALPIPAPQKPSLSLPNSSGSSNRIDMVASQCKQPLEYPPSPSISLSGNRCLRVGMGSSVRQRENLGAVVSRRSKSAFQSAGNASRAIRLGRSLSLPIQLVANDSERQQDCRFVSKERRRNEIHCIDGSLLQNILSPRSLQYSRRNSLSPREIQFRSGSTIALKSDTRMASPSRDNRDNIYKVGNPADRSICIGDSARRPQVRGTRRDRSASPIPRCLQPDVELPAGLAVSTAIPYSTSASPLEYLNRNVPNSSPSVVESILETRSEKPSASPTLYHSQPGSSFNRYHDQPSPSQSPGHDSGGMEMWGWEESVKSWSLEQKTILRSSWRQSSLKTYLPAWKRWKSWCHENEVNIIKPSGSDLARFLIDLYQSQGLAYSTILVYKSAIVTFCDPNHDTKLSSHILVKHALKAILNLNPKSEKVPIWDTEVLIQWLQNHSPNVNSLFECSKRASILLLLCSGRRVHDLTLLTTSPDHCIIQENHIIFWPIFGSKTDSATYRQSGWRLLKNDTCENLDPVFWVNRVITLSAERRAIANSNALFLTACGPPKAASRTVIANWVKKVLLEASIRASPGSVRPAVASKCWVQDCPLDEILGRGNWRTQNTFKKFYCREIKQPSTNCVPVITNLFTPIND